MATNRQWLINGNPRGRALEMTDFKYHEAELAPWPMARCEYKLST